jgi:N-acetylneuraminic acid mutarotase
MCKKHLLMIALMALFVPSALLGQEFNHLTYFTQTSTDDFKHGTPYMVDVADGTVSLQYRMASVAEWASTSNMPQNLKRHQMVTWRDYVYCVGGYNGSDPVNTVYRATQQTNGISGWSGLNAMPLALKDLAVVATQTSLIVMGGVNNEGASDKIYYAPFNNDGSIGAWTESEVTLPQPMYGMRAIQALGNIYLIGGTTVNGEEETLVKNVYLLKVDAHGEVTSITTTTSLPEVRGGHAVAFYDSKIYVTGGYDASQTAKSTVYSAAVNLNGTLGSWSTRTALPKALYDHTAVVSNGELVVMGGSDGSIASNAVYHTPLDATNLEWTLSDVFLTERLSQAVSFAFGNKIFFCGGEAISGVVNSNVNFMAVTTSDKPIRKTAFVGETFYVGAPKTLQQFNYTLNVGSGTSYEILYRTAGADKVFGNWTSKSANQPAAIGENKCYVQYMFRFTATASCTENLSLEEVTLVVNGCSQLAGNLNDVSTLTLAGSPYWVTESISFTNGTHNIEAGVVIYFRANTMLSITQASVNFNGTAANPILLTYEDVDEGMWDGVRFEDASDNGVSSVMNYTNIEKAGHGETRANLRLNYTNQPTMNHCTFNHSSVHGILMYNSSPAMTACAMNDNAENGLWLDNSAPNCTSCTLDGNGFAGIYHYNANFNAVFSGVTTSNNLYGLYSCTPNRSFTYEQEALSFVNNGSDIAMAGGQVGSDQTWNKFTNGYALLGNVEVYGGTPKLTVKPGAIIKVAQNYGFYVGRNGNQGGMLYAVGTASQPITFTALNGEVAGWEGVRFRDGSDYSSTSSMRYCLVEKATTNLVCENTNQPSVLWSTFQDARDQDVYLNNSNISIEGSTIKNSVKGLWVNSSSPTLVSVVFENHSEVCVYHNNTCNVTYSDCTLKDSYFGIRYETVERDMANNPNVVFENNYANIAMPGGHIQETRIWDSNSYAILGDLRVGRPADWTPNHNRLTIMPGSTVMFSEGRRMDIGGRWSYTTYWGELYAEGTSEQPITFTSLNGEVGGWNGLVFNSESDDFEGASSSLKHCIFEKANERNLHLGSTNQPGLIEDCIFRQSVQQCVYMGDSRDTLRNCVFEDNQGHSLYYNNAHYVGVLENLTFTGNQYDGVTVEGGHITEDRIWNAYTYFLLNDIRVGRPADWTPNHNRLVLMPGTTLKFAPGRRMDIGGRWSYTTYWGEIYAEGTEDQPILFTPMNDEIGGWNGLVFNSESDDFEGASSSLKHCIFEKANERNLYLGSTYQPGLVEDCIFRQSVQRGVEMIDSRDTLRNCVFEDNQGHSLYYNNAHFVGVLENLTFTGNQYDGVTVNGGHITEDRTWNAYTYYVMENMNVGRHISWDPNHCRLTLMPGTTIKVAQGRRISIAVDDYCGELYAVGTKEQPILFTSINGEVGGWNGMVFPGRSDDYENPSSLLKHCIFEKGNEYNLFITGTTLPEIEDCLFQQSNQFGLRIANEYCQTIKNTVIKDNASHGIYITDNTPFTLGGAPEYACSIYNNGGYGVYQDGYTNIDMSCNFWGNISYKYIDDNFIYDKKDNASKGSITYEPVSWFPMEDFAHVQGTFVYNDTKLMRNREMNVIDAAGEAMATTTTNNNGQFDFSNYQVGVFNTLDTDYGIDILAAVNATDALLTMRHFVHLDTLAYDQAVAADVNGNGSINGTDAMLILRRAIDEEFPLGDFYYYNPNGVIINDDVCTIDLSFICYGDVNGSYSPQNRDNTMTMLSVGQLLADSDQLLDLPVTLKSPAETGALTLRFAYPEAYLEVVDVTLASTGESLLFTADHGELKVVWYSLEPLALAENDGLIIIKARTKDLSDLDEPIAFSLDAYSELANGSAQVLDGVVIAMPVIVTSTLGVHEGAMTEGAHVSTYPNPVNDVCHLTYDLAEAGRVTVSVYNMMGVKVLDVADLHQEEGKHEMEWSTLNLAAGVYNCRVTFEGASSWVKSTVIIIEK